MQFFTWNELLEFFEKKYNAAEFYFLWRSITYFEDADIDGDIKGFGKYNVSWDFIKKFVRKNCKEF